MIQQPYVLFTRIPITKDLDGRLYCDPLWAKDLRLHLSYIDNLQLCCPVIVSQPADDMADITGFNIRRVHELQADRGLLSVVANWWPNFFRVWRASRHAGIVHSGGAGWAFPLSFYLLPISWWSSFRWVLVMESSFWMLDRTQAWTLRSVSSHLLHRILLARCMKCADARIFTQSFYRRYLLGSNTERSCVAPAVWVDQEDIVSEKVVQHRLQQRDPKSLRLFLPSRLTRDKGVFLLEQAIALLNEKHCTCEVTIMGAGELTDYCRQLARRDFGCVTVVYREPVGYGEPFFTEMQTHDATLVLNLKEEQPRILFDSFSQGLPVIAADTSGISDIVEHRNTGLLFSRGDPASLADAIEIFQHDSSFLQRTSLHALSAARGKTHRQMHLDRLAFLRSTIGAA